MGCTHYWTRKPRFEKKEWNEFVKDVATLLYNADCPLSFYYKGEPRKGFKATSIMINFNGEGEESHENVYIPRIHKKDTYSNPDENGQFFGFCKTACKPYDKYVTACLLMFKKHMGDNVTISSDGDPTDWEEGRQLTIDVWDCEEITEKDVIDWLGYNSEEIQEEAVKEEAEPEATPVQVKELDLSATEEQKKKFKEEYFGVDI